MPEHFFAECQEQSQVKATIVSKYFTAWARVIVATQKRFPAKSDGRIAYIDLFAGPGRYKDGTISTPLKVLDAAIQSEDLCARLVTCFNDKDAANTNSLKAAIGSMPGMGKLKHQPSILNFEVGEDVVKVFEGMRMVPTLFFVDPWGYKGLSLRLINSVLKDWGCDCIFFFNYNRINMGFGNAAVAEHIDALFGAERGAGVRSELTGLSSQQRELLILERLCEALIEMGGQFTLPFRFKNGSGQRTSHHLIFVSKAFRGYEIMKEIMAREGTKAADGLPSFEYNPASANLSFLFGFITPQEQLAPLLQDAFKGRKLLMREVYEQHNVGTRFIKKNYKDALMALESEGKIAAEPPADKRRKGTMADDVVVCFPGRQG